MAGRLIARLPKSVVVAADLLFRSAGGRRQGRTFAAFIAGVALLAASALAPQADLAGASDDRRSIFAALDPGRGAAGNAPRLVEIPLNPTIPTRHGKRPGASAATSSPRRPVCVRLCDGFFFPLSSFSRSDAIASQDAACTGLCPDAATALYFLPAGSDKIQDAASVSGERYTALPASLRYRATRDRACACRGALARDPPYWQDPTLRKGDVVATSTGFVVFRGDGRTPFGSEDFVALAAASIPEDRRAALTAIERAGAPPTRLDDRAQIAAAPAPDPKARRDNEIRFLEPPAAATN